MLNLNPVLKKKKKKMVDSFGVKHRTQKYIYKANWKAMRGYCTDLIDIT